MVGRKIIRHENAADNDRRVGGIAANPTHQFNIPTQMIEEIQ